MSNKTPAASEKSATELLIEQLAAEKLREQVNPLAKVETKTSKKDEKKATNGEAQVVSETKFANGAVVRNLA